MTRQSTALGLASLIEGARQRATLGVLTPDAIHVATALSVGCEVFLSNDRKHIIRFRRTWP